MDKIKAVGYCRYSSTNQREESITAQKRFLGIFAQNFGYEIIDFYIDEAESGKTVDRPAFQKLLKDIQDRNCAFNAVLVHKIDRFSRNTVDTLKYKEIFRDNNISLVSTMETIDNTPAGKMLLTIMSGVNEYYINNLSLEVIKGMIETALKGKWTGGTAPLGYDVLNQKLIINEKEAEIVRMIFQMTADGYGYGKIIEKLNALGYRTKIGNSFGKNSLYDLLKNERYKGTYVFNKRSSPTSLNKRNNHKYKDEKDIIRIENGCPAIVSAELWNRANLGRKLSSKIATNAKNPYLLTGLLYCSECGAKMHGNQRSYKGDVYGTYRCNKKDNQKIAVARK